MHLSTNYCTMNFDGKCKVSTNENGQGGYHTKEELEILKEKDPFVQIWSGANDGVCIIRDSQLLVGTIDKNQIGASNQGLIHSIFELYKYSTIKEDSTLS